MDYEEKLIDGKKIASELESRLREKVAKLPAKPKIVSILVGDDPASILYSNIKQKKATDIGIDFGLVKFDSNATFRQVAEKINGLNNDMSVDGIMIQMPLPDKFLNTHAEQELINIIDPKKDVDGLRDDSLYLHATAKAVMTILEYEDIELSGKDIVVVGATGMVGKPLVKAMEKIGAKVVGVDSKTIDLGKVTSNADILISCVGQRNLIGLDEIKPGAVIVDVGMDVDFEKVYPKVSKITPPKGGIGPVTVVCLMENVVEATKYSFT